MTIHTFDSLESTNKYCEALDLERVEDFTCFWALQQTVGIGQRGNHWASEPHKNLTFSLVLHPTFLPAARQFALTQALSLALTDYLSSRLPAIDTLIKWPNDIYMAPAAKICGILVSTRLHGTAIGSAVCGIGLNVNQLQFPDWVPNPTSMALLAGHTFDTEAVLHDLLHCLQARYDGLAQCMDYTDEYLSRLWRLGQRACYRYQGADVEATIDGIDAFGHLVLTTADGRQLRCAMKEISFL